MQKSVRCTHCWLFVLSRLCNLPWSPVPHNRVCQQWECIFLYKYRVILHKNLHCTNFSHVASLHESRNYWRKVAPVIHKFIYRLINTRLYQLKKYDENVRHVPGSLLTESKLTKLKRQFKKHKVQRSLRYESNWQTLCYELIKKEKKNVELNDFLTALRPWSETKKQ